MTAPTPELRSTLRKIEEKLHRAANGGDKRIGPLKETMRLCRDLAREALGDDDNG